MLFNSLSFLAYSKRRERRKKRRVESEERRASGEQRETREEMVSKYVSHPPNCFNQTTVSVRQTVQDRIRITSPTLM